MPPSDVGLAPTVSPPVRVDNPLTPKLAREDAPKVVVPVATVSPLLNVASPANVDVLP